MEAVVFGTLIAVVQKVTEHFRPLITKLIPGFDGYAVSLFAAGFGLLLAAGTDVRVLIHLLPENEVAGWLDLLVTGISLGAGAGFLADFTGRSGGESETPQTN